MQNSRLSTHVFGTIVPRSFSLSLFELKLDFSSLIRFEESVEMISTIGSWFRDEEKRNFSRNFARRACVRVCERTIEWRKPIMSRLCLQVSGFRMLADSLASVTFNEPVTRCRHRISSTPRWAGGVGCRSLYIGRISTSTSHVKVIVWGDAGQSRIPLHFVQFRAQLQVSGVSRNIVNCTLVKVAACNTSASHLLTVSTYLTTEIEEIDDLRRVQNSYYFGVSKRLAGESLHAN